MGKKAEKSFYNGVVEANEGIEVKDVKRLFLWYDLLSCLLPFQLIFIITYALGSKYYSLTICSLFFICRPTKRVPYNQFGCRREIGTVKTGIFLEQIQQKGTQSFCMFMDGMSDAVHI